MNWTAFSVAQTEEADKRLFSILFLPPLPPNLGGNRPLLPQN